MRSRKWTKRQTCCTATTPTQERPRKPPSLCIYCRLEASFRLMHRVLIVDSIAPAGENRLSQNAELIWAPDSAPETIRRLAREADGVITRSKLPEGLFSAAPRVRAVAIHGTGTDLVPLAEATARGVMVSNVPGGNAQSVAEYCAMAILVLTRNTLAIHGTGTNARDRRHDPRHRRRRRDRQAPRRRRRNPRPRTSSSSPATSWW